MILSLYFDEKSLIAELVEFFTNLSIFEPFLWLCLSLIPVWKNKKKKKATNQQFKKVQHKTETQERVQNLVVRRQLARQGPGCKA